MTVDRLEPRAGGSYRFVFRFPDQLAVPVNGEYTTFDPPRRLAFTWTWEPPDPFAGVPTTVTVDFDEKDGGTEVVVNHGPFPTEEKLRMHERGWAGTLARLEHIL
jgi:uncharacterized protein YndB with AHSA1/START domain